MKLNPFCDKRMNEVNGIVVTQMISCRISNCLRLEKKQILKYFCLAK